MSFVLCPFYKLILNDDIKRRILNKIHEIQCHSEWNTFDLHINISDIEISSINIDDIIKQRNIWKNIAKLSIDLWRDFDYYQQFIFKSQFDDDDEYKKRLERLGCICEERVWRSVSRPSEEVVQTSVFMYCLYEMMIKEKIGYIYTVKSIICIFCDSEIENSEDNCNICGATKEEREEHQNNIDSGQNKQINNVKEDKNESKINKNGERRLIKKKEDNLVEEECEVKMKDICLVNVEDKSSQTAVIFKDVSLQTFCNVEDKSSQTLVNINNEDDKDEHLINKLFEDGNNEVKYNDNDKLIRKRCSFEFRNADKSNKEINLREKSINKVISTNICNDFFTNEIIVSDKKYNFKPELNQEKLNKADKRIKYVDKHNLDKWKCGKCGFLNEYTFGNCKVCCGSYRHGKWNCGSCTMENSCFNSRCSECGENNINVKNAKKINDEISDSIKIINELKINNKKHEEKTSNDKWKCEKCSLKNSCVNDNCEGCNKKNVNIIDKVSIWYKENVNEKDKFDSLKKEIDKKKLINDKEIGYRQWKCERCEVLNLYSVTLCSECRERRLEFGLWRCTQCSLINKCGDVKCTACGVMNDNLLIKHCKYCKKNKLKGGEVQCSECIKNKCNTWKCPFAHCGELNVKKDDYCQKCRIYYYSSQSRGMPVKVYNQEIYMWICYKCHKNIKMNSNICECGNKRSKRGMIEKFCDFLK